MSAVIHSATARWYEGLFAPLKSWVVEVIFVEGSPLGPGDQESGKGALARKWARRAAFSGHERFDRFADPQKVADEVVSRQGFTYFQGVGGVDYVLEEQKIHEQERKKQQEERNR